MAATIIGQLERALGKGKKKVFAGTVSVANGDTVDTGLSSVDAAILTTSDAAHIAAVTGVSGGTITIGLMDNAGGTITTAETVYILAIGDPA